MEKLSSGLRINRAGDDAAGLAISEKMRGQIRGLKQATRNAQDGISLIQTAEGALNETHSILQRMRELATQASNDTNTLVDRKEIQKEINELIGEIDRIGNITQVNTQNLLDGTFTGKFHIGANEGQSIDMAIGSMKAGVVASITIDRAASIDPAFTGGSVTSAAGFSSTGAVTFAVTHSSGSPAEQATATFSVSGVPADDVTLTINGYRIGFKDGGEAVSGADTTIDTNSKDAAGVARHQRIGHHGR